MMENKKNLIGNNSSEHQWILHYSRHSLDTIHLKVQYTNIFSAYPERSSTKDKIISFWFYLKAGRI